ncbi:hypothetical protein ANCDUO_16175 [Ancylostoma duodenale]|uniref:Uncharacterized protein n=1 Tax=Ancylostoma duodenale TaxID=51022 RepID=A0A0C2G9R3_9BILA|nr:hypothetical protein ANCDUO_16175 [Ancylostoma duodenale]
MDQLSTEFTFGFCATAIRFVTKPSRPRDDCLVSGTPQQDELPLPPNWAIAVTAQGYRWGNRLSTGYWVHS